MLRLSLIYIACILLFVPTQAQDCMNWQQQLGTQENENALDVKVAPNGQSYWIVGFNNTDNGLNESITSNGWLLEFNLDGTLEEDYQFGNEDAEVFSALDFLNNEIVIGGYRSKFDSTYYEGIAPSNFWMVNTDENALLNWEINFGGTGDDKILDVATSSSNIFFTGYSDSTDDDNLGNYGDDDLIVGKLNNQGDIEWIKNYGGSAEDKGNNIHVIDDQLFVFGQTRSSDNDVSNNIGSRDYWLLELDIATGEIIREKTFGGGVGDVGIEMVYLGNENWALIGESLSANGDVSNTLGNGDFWVLKIDGDWNIVWEKSFGGSSADFPQSIAVNNEGEILIAGSTLSDDENITSVFGFIDTWLAKLNSSNGNIIWQQSIGGNDLDFATKIITYNDEILVAGFTDSPSIECGRQQQLHEFHDLWFFSLKQPIVNVADNELIETEFDIIVRSNSIDIISNEEFNFQMISPTGQVLQHINNITTGAYTFHNNALPYGIYILSITNSNNRLTKKIYLGN